MDQSSQNKDLAVKVILGAGGLALGYFGIIRPLLKTFGVIKTDEDKKVEDNSGADVWDVNWYKKLPVNAKLMKMAETNDLIDRLWDATGFFNDNEEQIYGVFRQIRYKSQVGQLNYYFLANKKYNLYDYLMAYLNTSEMSKVIQIINDMPRGY